MNMSHMKYVNADTYNRKQRETAVRYIKSTEAHLDAIADLVRETITTIYPKYYPKEVVDFFRSHHDRDAIASDIRAGNVWALFMDERLVGTGSRDGNHITRVYVSPDCQRNGFGTFIMRKLEEEICRDSDRIILDASLPASHLYEKFGYRTIRHEKHDVENGVVLVYEVMEKRADEASKGACPGAAGRQIP